MERIWRRRGQAREDNHRSRGQLKVIVVNMTKITESGISEFNLRKYIFFYSSRYAKKIDDFFKINAKFEIVLTCLFNYLILLSIIHFMQTISILFVLMHLFMYILSFEEECNFLNLYYWLTLVLFHEKKY